MGYNPHVACSSHPTGLILPHVYVNMVRSRRSTSPIRALAVSEPCFDLHVADSFFSGSRAHYHIFYSMRRHQRTRVCWLVWGILSAARWRQLLRDGWRKCGTPPSTSRPPESPLKSLHRAGMAHMPTSKVAKRPATVGRLHMCLNANFFRVYPPRVLLYFLISINIRVNPPHHDTTSFRSKFR